MKLSSIVAVVSGTLASAFLFFLLTPSIIESFGFERFGYITLLLLLLSSVSLLDLGVSRAATYFVSKNNRDKLGIIWAVSFYIMIWSFIVSVVFYFLYELYINNLNINLELLGELDRGRIFVVLSIPMVILYSLFRGVLEGLKYFYITSLMKVVLSSFMFGSLYLSIFFESTLLYVSVSFFVVRLFCLLILLLIVLNFIPVEWRSDKESVFEILDFSWKSSISSICSTVLNSMDRFVAGVFVNSSSFGLYSLISELFNRLLFMPGAICTVLFPEIAKSKTGDIKVLYRKAVLYLICAMAPVLLILNFFGGELVSIWLGNDLDDHIMSNYIAVFSLVVLFISFSQINYAFIQGLGGVSKTAKLHFYQLLTFMPLYIVSTKFYGIKGLLFILLTRSFCDLALHIFYYRKVYGENYD